MGIRVVRLVDDVENVDGYDRLLRYVYVEEEMATPGSLSSKLIGTFRTLWDFTVSAQFTMNSQLCTASPGSIVHVSPSTCSAPSR